MTLSQFFLSSSGRISRQEYWLGIAALMAITVLGAQLLDADSATLDGGRMRAPSFAITMWSLVLAWPSTAISIKRFNDRDWPGWLGYALGASMVGFMLANYNGFMLDPDTMSPVEKLITTTAAIGFLWALIENGFQRGTPGPNRYGPDPLQTASD